jgi:hypothetical protein
VTARANRGGRRDAPPLVLLRSEDRSAGSPSAATIVSVSAGWSMIASLVDDRFALINDRFGT